MAHGHWKRGALFLWATYTVCFPAVVSAQTLVTGIIEPTVVAAKTHMDAYLFRLQLELNRIATRLAATKLRADDSPFSIGPDQVNLIQVGVTGKAIYANMGQPDQGILLGAAGTLPLPCYEEANIAHRLIHFAQAAEKLSPQNVKTLEWEPPMELWASSGEVRYADGYCRVEELTFEQRTLADVNARQDHSEFQRLVQARTPLRETVNRLESRDAADPHQLASAFGLLVDELTQISQQSEQVLKQPNPEEASKVYQRLQAVREVSPRLISSAQMGFQRLLQASGTTADQIQDIDVVNELFRRYNRTANRLKEQQPSLWAAVVSNQ